MLRNKKINISKDFIDLLKIHFNNDYEVGGVIFAYKKGFKNIIDTLSFKKGEKMHIDFNDDDNSLFEVPPKHFIVGTWHTHPFQNKITASNIDLLQWKKWNKKYLHLIFNGNGIKIYTAKGEIIYDRQI